MQSILDFVKSAVTLTLALGPNPEVDGIKPDHFLRTEGHGSFIPSLETHQQTADWLLGRDWVEVTEEVNQSGAGFGCCRYFQTGVPEGLEAFTNVVTLEHLTPEQEEQVRVRKGLHGDRELYIPELEPQPAHFVVLAVGNLNDPFSGFAEESAVVYTWHPGPPAPPLNPQCVVKG